VLGFIGSTAVGQCFGPAYWLGSNLGIACRFYPTGAPSLARFGPGIGGSNRCAAPQRRGSSDGNDLDRSFTDNQTALAGPIHLMLASDWQEDRAVRRLNRAPLFGFCSLQRLPTEPVSFRRQPAFGLSRFDVFSSLRFCCHSSSQAADVGHACDRGSDSIMRHRPLSRWRSAIDLRLASVWSIAPSDLL